MKLKKQRIAIAEACGWKVRENAHLAKPQGGEWQYMDEIPDYLNDLNAMHEAEKILTENQLDYYAEWLKDGNSSGGFPSQLCHWHATAVQRAEAFLRTIGKWTTNPNEL